MEFMKVTHCTFNDTEVIEIDEDEDDVHMNIIDILSGSENEFDCKSWFAYVSTSLKSSYCLKMPWIDVVPVVKLPTQYLLQFEHFVYHWQPFTLDSPIHI